MNKKTVVILSLVGFCIVILSTVLGIVITTEPQPYKGPWSYDGTAPPTLYKGVVTGVDTSKPAWREHWRVKFSGNDFGEYHWKAQSFYHRQFGVGETVYVEIIKTPTDGVIYEDAYLIDLTLGNFLIGRGEAKLLTN